MPATTPPIWITRPAFISIVAAAVESYNREATGFLVGRPAVRTMRKRRRKVVLIETAYPLLTSTRNPSWVAPANEAAYNRAVRVVHGMDTGLEVIGGFHSHPNNPPTLSDGDVEFILQHSQRAERRGWKLHQDRWLELIVGIKRRKVKRENGADWYWSESGPDIRARLWVSGGERYDIHASAKWVEPAILNDRDVDWRTAVKPAKLMLGL